MIARYEIDSCKTRFEDRESRHGKTRIDEFALALDAYKMPVVRGSKSIVYGKAATMAEDFRDHEPSIRCVSVRDDGCVQAEYLTAKCPFCGQDNELRHDSWLVAVRDNGAEAESTDSPAIILEGKAHSFAGYPSCWMPLDKKRFLPLTECEKTVERPFGSLPSLNDLESIIRQGPLQHDGDNGSSTGNEYGNPRGYKGIYPCDYCRAPFYVVYSPARRREVARLSEYVAFEDETAGSGLAREINATITSREDMVEIRFDPPVGGIGRRVESIAYDLTRGFTIVDGKQMMKENLSTRTCIAAFPSGLECPGLISHVASLIEERIGPVSHSVDVLQSSFGCFSCGFLAGSLMGFAFLAIANRLRNYPDALYENILDREHLRYLQQELRLKARWIRRFDALPIRYEDIEPSYIASGLPNIKSIRRLAFSQPLVIAAVAELDRIPFDDPNILDSLLGHESALQILDAITGEYDEASVFTCLKESRGELATWKYIEGLVKREKQLGIIGSGGSRAALSPELMRVACSMSIRKAAELFHTALIHFDIYSGKPNDKYNHPPSMRRLEGVVDGFEFLLPSTPLDLVVAGADMGNCLAGYINHFDGSGTDVLLIRKSGQLVGAAEVNDERTAVVQAKARYNHPIDSNPLLLHAFASWLKDKGLQYDPHPWNE